MTALGCNYSAPLLAGLRDGSLHVDWIKLSREDTLFAEIDLCRPVRPALVHTLSRAGLPPDRFAAIDWAELNRAVHLAGSPHIALHLQCKDLDWPAGAEPAQAEVVDRLVTHTLFAKSQMHVPLLLENVPWGGDERSLKPVADPEVISFVAARTDVGLLLDTAHLLCAADHLGVDPRSYAQALPLGRVQEIHVAGNRRDPQLGLLDTHAELQAEEYEFLAWVLERTASAVVTLEYGGTGPFYERPGMTDPEALQRQLTRLAGILQA